MSKYYKAEDVLAIFSEEERPLNWTDSEAEIQADNDFDYYKGMIESLPTIEVSEDCISRKWLKENAKVLGDYYENTVWAVPLSILEDAPSVVPTTEQSSKVGECFSDIERKEYEELKKRFHDFVADMSGAKMRLE